MALSYQDVLWSVNGANTALLDLSLGPIVCNPRRVSDFLGFSWHFYWTGTPSGTLQVQASNASVLGDQLVQPAQWVPRTGVSLTIGSGTTPAQSPSMLEVALSRTGWASVLWTPASSGNAASGTSFLSVKFDGVRK